MAQEIFEKYVNVCLPTINDSLICHLPLVKDTLTVLQIKYLVRLHKPTIRTKLVLSSEILASG